MSHPDENQNTRCNFTSMFQVCFQVYMFSNICLFSIMSYIYVIITSVITNNTIIIRLQRPESGCVVLALACVGVCVVRPFPGGRHSHAARRAG